MLWPVAILVKWVYRTLSPVCAFSKNRSFWRLTKLIQVDSYYYVCRGSAYCVQMSLILTVRCTVGDNASASRFCDSAVRIADVSGRKYRTVCDITCRIHLIFLFESRRNVLFEIQHIKNIEIISIFPDYCLAYTSLLLVMLDNIRHVIEGFRRGRNVA